MIAFTHNILTTFELWLSHYNPLNSKNPLLLVIADYSHCFPSIVKKCDSFVINYHCDYMEHILKKGFFYGLSPVFCRVTYFY